MVVVGSKEESRDVARLTHVPANSEVGNPVRKRRDREIDAVSILGRNAISPFFYLFRCFFVYPILSTIYTDVQWHWGSQMNV
jgi:hypothetical protein